MTNRIPSWLLKQRQALPLEQKIELSKAKIQEWYEHWDGMVYVAFSGGKDSTVLLHLVRSMYHEVPAVFYHTGLQFPEVVKFAKSHDGVTTIKPDLTFGQVIDKHGYPVISKRNARFLYDLQNESEHNQNTCNLRRTGMNRKGEYCPSMKLPNKYMYLVDAPFKISGYCCDEMKKKPANKYSRESKRKAILGSMACESNRRLQDYKRRGCLWYDTEHPVALPLSFWLEEDVLQYILDYDIEIASVYGDIVKEDNHLELTGEPRTGCIFCAFGAHLEPQPNRFQRLKETHPRLWSYCMDKLGMREVLDYIGVPYE